MKLCRNKHSEIIYDDRFRTTCPLCQLRKHNNIVHDFIESEEINMVDKLVEYQAMREKEDSKCTN